MYTSITVRRCDDLGARRRFRVGESCGTGHALELRLAPRVLELRFLLKRNGVSYHKPGKSNMMKTKLDMATDLVVRLAYACAVYLHELTTLLPRRCWRQAASGRRIRWLTTR